MSDNLNYSVLKKKSLRGVFSLLQQTFIIQIIGVVATLVQAAYFGAIDFGVLGIANSIISFLTYFSDVGLAGALIQKKEDLTKKDLETTFTIQQILAVIIVIMGFLLTPFLTRFYSFSEQGILLFHVLLISFFISSFKTIPAILLERKLDFQKLIIPQILETLVYNIVLTILAIQGLGLTSIMWAATMRSIVGLTAVFILSPWRISLGIDKLALHKLFRFGIPYQINSFIAMAKDDVLFLFLGTVLPLSNMGYITLAKKLADLPLRTIMDSVTRVTFPAFSRMQQDVTILRKALEYTTFGIASLVFPIYISAVFFIQPFISVVPRYQKWEPSLLSFYILCLCAVAASFSTPLVNALSAIGKIRVTTKFMITWLILTWVFVVPLVNIFGFNGFAIALAVVSLTVIAVIRVMQHFIPFSFIRSMRMPFLASIVLTIWYASVIPRIHSTFALLFLVGIVGVVLYGSILGILEKETN